LTIVKGLVNFNQEFISLLDVLQFQLLINHPKASKKCLFYRNQSNSKHIAPGNNEIN